jgi:hypothetical protein
LRFRSTGDPDGDPITDKSRRKELLRRYRQTVPEADVYLIRNSGNGKALLGSPANRASLRGDPATLDRLREKLDPSTQY